MRQRFSFVRILSKGTNRLLNDFFNGFVELFDPFFGLPCVLNRVFFQSSRLSLVFEDILVGIHPSGLHIFQTSFDAFH